MRELNVYEAIYKKDEPGKLREFWKYHFKAHDKDIARAVAEAYFTLKIKEYEPENLRVDIMASINQYGYFVADYIKAIEAPHWNRYKWMFPEKLSNGMILLSKSRCKALKVSVGKTEDPVAYRCVQNGYCGLYDRTGKVDSEKLYPGEVYDVKQG